MSTPQIINIGALPNDGEGDPLRVAFQKVNNNFANVFLTNFNITQAVTSGNEQGQVIFEYPADIFTQGTLQVRSYDPGTPDMQNIVLSAAITNNLGGVRFSGYGTSFEGNALCGLNMDVLDNNVRLLVNPVANTTIYHYICYQITSADLVSGSPLGLDGYPEGTVMGTEDDIIITTELPE
jgi:hypothetical protein